MLAGNEVCNFGRSLGTEVRAAAVVLRRMQGEGDTETLEFGLRPFGCLGERARDVFELLLYPPASDPRQCQLQSKPGLALSASAEPDDVGAAGIDPVLAWEQNDRDDVCGAARNGNVNPGGLMT